ncbi:MAG: DNA-3-methyladenine glycosylase family protein [Candidatus Thorarchaeota archaeon]
MSIKSPKNYDLLSSVHAWIFPDIQPVPEQTSHTSLWRMFSFEDKSIPLRISQNQPGEDLRVEWDDSSISDNEVHSKLERILNLDMNMNPALSKIKKLESFPFLFNKIKGLRPYLADTLFEALTKTVIQQQISYRAANVITQRLILETSNLINSKEHVFGFPSPEEILTLGVDGLRAIGFGYKTEYVDSICRMVVNDNLQLDALNDMEYVEWSKILTSVRGIGQWTADVVAIAGIGDYSIYPFGDLGIQNLLGKMFAHGRRLRASEVKDYSDSWGPEGPLVLYLLMCSDVLGYMEEHGRSGKP